MKVVLSGDCQTCWLPPFPPSNRKLRRYYMCLVCEYSATNVRCTKQAHPTLERTGLVRFFLALNGAKSMLDKFVPKCEAWSVMVHK